MYPFFLIFELLLTFYCMSCTQPVTFHSLKTHVQITGKNERGQKDLFDRIIFMMDDSGSTIGARKARGNDPRFSYRERAVRDIVNEYARFSHVNYALGEFGRDRVRFYEFCSTCLGGRRFFGSALDIKTALDDYVANRRHGGDTPYLSAMYALEYLIGLNASHTYAVEFISDGQPTDMATSSEAHLDQELFDLVKATVEDVPELTQPVEFNTFYFGPNPTSYADRWFEAEDAILRLQIMATAGHGHFIDLHKSESAQELH